VRATNEFFISALLIESTHHDQILITANRDSNSDHLAHFGRQPGLIV
jgi:hypothetical protein